MVLLAWSSRFLLLFFLFFACGVQWCCFNVGLMTLNDTSEKTSLLFFLLRLFLKSLVYTLYIFLFLRKLSNMKFFYAFFFLIQCILWLDEVDSFQRNFRSIGTHETSFHLMCTSVDDFDDLLEEIVFSGDVSGYVQKAASKDVVLTGQFLQYVNDATKKSTDDDEKQLLDLIASLITSRQGIDKDDDKEVADFRINNNLPMNVAEGFQSASGIFQPVKQLSEVEDDLDWRERMKIMQRGEERDVSGKVVDRLGVFDKKKETTAIKHEVTTIDPVEAAKKAQAAADIMKKNEEEMLAIQRANIEREAANQKVWKGF